MKHQCEDLTHYMQHSKFERVFSLRLRQDTLRNFNKMIFGELGSGTKTIIFKQKKFKKEFAPINAKIEYGEINGEKVVIMTYRV